MKKNLFAIILSALITATCTISPINASEVTAADTIAEQSLKKSSLSDITFDIELDINECLIEYIDNQDLINKYDYSITAHAKKSITNDKIIVTIFDSSQEIGIKEVVNSYLKSNNIDESLVEFEIVESSKIQIAKSFDDYAKEKGLHCSKVHLYDESYDILLCVDVYDYHYEDEVKEAAKAFLKENNLDEYTILCEIWESGFLATDPTEQPTESSNDIFEIADLLNKHLMKNGFFNRYGYKPTVCTNKGASWIDVIIWDSTKENEMKEAVNAFLKENGIDEKLITYTVFDSTDDNGDFETECLYGIASVITDYIKEQGIVDHDFCTAYVDSGKVVVPVWNKNEEKEIKEAVKAYINELNIEEALVDFKLYEYDLIEIIKSITDYLKEQGFSAWAEAGGAYSEYNKITITIDNYKQESEIMKSVQSFMKANNIDENIGTDCCIMDVFVPDLGDVNYDNMVNVRDCAHIAKAIASGEADKLPKESDFNNDGKINIRDAAALAKNLISETIDDRQEAVNLISDFINEKGISAEPVINNDNISINVNWKAAGNVESIKKFIKMKKIDEKIIDYVIVE